MKTRRLSQTLDQLAGSCHTGYFTYGPGARSWSNMVYAPSTCAKGYVRMDVGYANAETYVYQNSCRF